MVVGRSTAPVVLRVGFAILRTSIARPYYSTLKIKYRCHAIYQNIRRQT
jgi:hypothetical protein